MRDVDFLPEWYKESRRRRSSVQRQYIALSLLFLLMIVWNALATRSIALATASLADAEPQRIKAEQVCYAFDQWADQLVQRQQSLRLLQAMEGQLDMASVLAELSALIDDPVTLETLDVIAERPILNKAEGPVRFQIVIKGLARDAAAVAAMLKAMETSAYLRQVHLVISRNLDSGDDRANVSGDTGTEPPAVAFEIRCYLATEGDSNHGS